MPGTLIRHGILDRHFKVFHPSVVEATDFDVVFGPAEGVDADGVWDGPGHLMDMDPTNKIRTRWFGKANAAQTATLRLKGYYDDGPGIPIADVLLTLGGSTIPSSSPFVGRMHDSVRKQFLGTGGNWREVHLYTITEYDTGIVTKVEKSNDNTCLDIDFTKGGYKYIAALLDLATMTECFGLYVPVF